MIGSCGGRGGRGGGGPTIRCEILFPPTVQSARGSASAPDDHFAANPNCSMKSSGRGCIVKAGRHPIIHHRIVSSATVQIVVIITAPDNHFATCPHCGVALSRVRCVSRASSCPTIGRGSVSSPTAVQGATAPDDHFTAGPNCHM